MGAPPRIKKKIYLNYRRAYKNQPCCQECSQYVPDYQVMGWMNAGVIKTEPRCRVMGLKNSIKYRVQPDHVCEEFYQKQE